MEALYNPTILLAIGLTAVLGAVFAIAVTFLGRSLQQAREIRIQEQQEVDAAAKASIDRIKEALERESSQNAIVILKKELAQAKWTDRRRRLKRLWKGSAARPQLLGVTGSVIFPGTFFILAAVLSAFAKADLEHVTGDPWLWWVTSVLALGIGIIFLLQTLREVERVSRVTDEAYFSSQVNALKQAMAERDEETRPILTLTCLESSPIR